MVERHIGTVSAAMQTLYQIVVVKRELSRKAKLLICQTHVRSKPHLWSWNVGNDWESKVMNTSGHNVWAQSQTQKEQVEVVQASG